MSRIDQRFKAMRFMAMHTSPGIVIIPNAWDVVSARIFELEGFQAIATTSGGIASTLGYPDGERMPSEEMLDAVQRIVDSTSLPVTADMEAGYGETETDVANTTTAVLLSGAVGMNLEDSYTDSHAIRQLPEQKSRIQAARSAAQAFDIHLIINARTDVFLYPSGDSRTMMAEAVKRGNAYREAGADCIFVPDVGLLDNELIATLVREIDAPVNIIAGERTAPVEVLEQLGVKRVTLGPRPMRATLALVRRIAHEIRVEGTFSTMNGDTVPYDEVNSWFDEDRAA